MDLLGSIDSAEATIRSAIERKESRGAHQRSDFVETDTNETVNYVVELVDGKQVLTRSTVAPLPDELEGPVKAYQELSVGGRLLE